MPLTKEGKPVLYKPWKNTTTSKNKFWVYVKSDTKKGFKRIGFGLKGMQDFTQHKDEKRRKSYLARAKGITNKEGKKTWTDKNTANYWATHFLWNA
tara:strand:- start:1260 stop:1547 length:288 start_codon:yes stop_codon:yes gene_type:complete